VSSRVRFTQPNPNTNRKQAAPPAVKKGAENLSSAPSRVPAIPVPQPETSPRQPNTRPESDSQVVITPPSSHQGLSSRQVYGVPVAGSSK
jgi:hypothetical protein